MNKLIKALISRPYVTPDFLDKSYFPSLDGWRAIAVMMVVIGHASSTINNQSLLYKLIDLFIYANLGVKIFFFLSGFLITTLLIKEYIKFGKINIKFFFIKRILRIFPVLYLFIIVLIIINAIFKLEISFDNFLAAALLYSNFKMQSGGWFTGHIWSLSVEEQFYLIWPFLFVFMHNKLYQFCITVILIVPCLRVYWYFYPNNFQVTLGPFLSYAETIFSGSFTAILSFKNFISSSSKIWSVKWLSIIAILILIFLNFLIRNGIAGIFILPLHSTINNLLLVFLMINTLINTKTLLYKVLNHKVMVQIGIISYSLYLWQQLFIVPMDVYADKVHWSIFPLNILFSLVTAYISYHYFEVYFLNHKKKFKSNKFTYEHSH